MIFKIGFKFGVKYDLGLLSSFMVLIHRPFLFAQDLHVNRIKIIGVCFTRKHDLSFNAL